MTDRKRKTKNPCKICFLHPLRCICSLIPILNLKTRVSLVIHAKELKRTTNTGRLAHVALSNSELLVRGLDLSPLNLSHLIRSDYESVVLFPSEEAIDIDDYNFKKPAHLIVPDGNWRQAAKLNTRQPEIGHLPRVKISQTNLSTYHLRREHLREGLSTLESIALAIESIEGLPSAKPLHELYKAKLNATLIGRGQKALIQPNNQKKNT